MVPVAPEDLVVLMGGLEGPVVPAEDQVAPAALTVDPVVLAEGPADLEAAPEAQVVPAVDRVEGLADLAAQAVDREAPAETVDPSADIR